MEDNLGEIGKGLGNMKNIAMTMNQEITRQNDQIDVIQAKVSSSISKLYVCGYFYHIFIRL